MINFKSFTYVPWRDNPEKARRLNDNDIREVLRKSKVYALGESFIKDRENLFELQSRVRNLKPTQTYNDKNRYFFFLNLWKKFKAKKAQYKHYGFLGTKRFRSLKRYKNLFQNKTKSD